MRFGGVLFAAFYAILMIFAVYNQKSRGISSAFIVIGGSLIGIYALFNIIGHRNLIIFLIVGMISISIGTLINGYKQNNIHIHHHAIRLIIETIVIAICWKNG